MRGIFHYQLPGETGAGCAIPVVQRVAVEKAAHDLPGNDYSRFWQRTTRQIVPLVPPLLHASYFVVASRATPVAGGAQS